MLYQETNHRSVLDPGRYIFIFGAGGPHYTRCMDYDIDSSSQPVLGMRVMNDIQKHRNGRHERLHT